MESCVIVVVISFPLPVPAKEVPGCPQNSIGQSLPPAPMPRKAYQVSPRSPSHYHSDISDCKIPIIHALVLIPGSMNFPSHGLFHV